MTRLVFETTKTEKAALTAALAPVGKTYTDWFTERLAETVLNEPAPQYVLKDLAHDAKLLDPSDVARELGAADWRFTDDDTQFLTHDVHPYPAKFIPQIPANLIRRLSSPGELVLDPFGGSGTTAVEAVRLGRNAVCFDANPLASLIGMVKTASIDAAALAQLQLLATAARSYLDSDPFELPQDAIRKWIPDIPNIEKWFLPVVAVELANLRRLISELTTGAAQDVAHLSLSRIIVRVSNQDSETRYVAKAKKIAPCFTTRAFVDSLRFVQKRVEQFSELKGAGCASFHTADSRSDVNLHVRNNSVGLIVSSPPYPNATDYHLYHRFRIFWLGFDPRHLGSVEIGSHLKHQRKNSGFEEYEHDMTQVLKNSLDALMPGRYAVFVVGDAVFSGEIFDTAAKLRTVAAELGFEYVATVTREIHSTRRSFSAPARRARSERLLILRKPCASLVYSVRAPRYRLWPYEEKLRIAELNALFGSKAVISGAEQTRMQLAPADRWKLARLTFASEYFADKGDSERTWQKLLENGDSDAVTRKEPKYVTHGLHAYKGKFYPQLAKALMNIAAPHEGASILDPFCGSGTVVLEGYLNGFRAYGCDMNPLAVKIARAKVEVLAMPRAAVDESLTALTRCLQGGGRSIPERTDQFRPENEDEIFSWFPRPVVFKLNWILGQIRLFGDPRLVNYLEVILSDCIRESSQQESKDLRIRRRAEPIEDAPVVEAFLARIDAQHQRLKHFWQVEGRRSAPFLSPVIREGDNRHLDVFLDMGLDRHTVDTVVTSPPYASALPYIDTDRLSLLTIMGIEGSRRRELEEGLTGSREIARSARNAVEAVLFSKESETDLPASVVQQLRWLHGKNISSGAGFRKLNMPAVLYRYFKDMKENISYVSKILKPSGKAYYVVGDSKTEVNGTWFPIRTTDWLCDIASHCGFRASRLMDISVTTENMKHIRHAITENAVLVFEKTS